VTCADARFRIFKTATSNTPEISTLAAMQISPNPSSNDTPTYLTLSATEGFTAELSLYDAAGKWIGPAQSINVSPGHNNIELPIQMLPKGIYFVSLQTREGRAIRKLIR
jgi:hypothetical protein